MPPLGHATPLAEHSDLNRPSGRPIVEIDVAIMDGAACDLAGQVHLDCNPQAASIEIRDGPTSLHAGRPEWRRNDTSDAGGTAQTWQFHLTAPLDLTAQALHRLTWTLHLPNETRLDLGHALISRIDIIDAGRDQRSGSHIEKTLSAKGIAIKTEADAARNFESLGDNCEFGIAMAHHAFTRPSLFRFGGTSEFHEPVRLPPDLLTTGIERYFEGLAEGDDLTFFRHDPEWIAQSTRYRFMGHTGLTDPALTQKALRGLHDRRVRLAVRTFVELAHSAETVFVRKSNGHEQEADLRAHLGALRSMGLARLLWVTNCAPGEPAGMVSLLGDGLIKARIARFAPYADAGNPDREAWRQIVANTSLILAGVMETQAM